MPVVPLINVRNVTVQRDLTTILSDLSWQVHPEEHWVVFGPNGAGKTSLLNVIQGYLWPTTGTVQMFGGTLGDGVDVREMRKAIPVVSESVRRLIHDHLTGLEVLVSGARGHLNIFSPVEPEEAATAIALAEETHIIPLLTKPFGVMSTGERQRVLLTRALLSNPRVIVLDEPCSGLDLAGREWVLHLMKSIMQRNSTPSLLLTTHHVEEISDGFTHVLLIKNGKGFSAGPIGDVFASENLSSIFDMKLEIANINGRWSARAVVG